MTEDGGYVNEYVVPLFLFIFLFYVLCFRLSENPLTLDLTLYVYSIIKKCQMSYCQRLHQRGQLKRIRFDVIIS